LGPTRTVTIGGRNSYTTVIPTDLALLEPLRLPTRILTLAGIDNPLPSPLNSIANAVQPALTILVNIGYSDVQTPTEGGTYNRTFDQFDDPNKPFLSESPLTPEEALQVPGDVLQALVAGILSQVPTNLVPATTSSETVNVAAASESAPSLLRAGADVSVSAGPVESSEDASPPAGDISSVQSLQDDPPAADLKAPTTVEKKKPEPRKQLKTVREKVETGSAGARQRLEKTVTDVRKRIDGFTGKTPKEAVGSADDGGADKTASDDSSSDADGAA
jgi:hypothetical protein